MSTFTESGVEAAALAWLQSLGWQVAHGRCPVLYGPGTLNHG